MGENCQRYKVIIKHKIIVSILKVLKLYAFLAQIFTWKRRDELGHGSHWFCAREISPTKRKPYLMHLDFFLFSVLRIQMTMLLSDKGIILVFFHPVFPRVAINKLI